MAMSIRRSAGRARYSHSLLFLLAYLEFDLVKVGVAQNTEGIEDKLTGDDIGAVGVLGYQPIRRGRWKRGRRLS